MNKVVLIGSCPCGASTFETTIVPRERFICHCLYCQAFVKKDYTDVNIFKAKDIVITNEEFVRYENPRKLPKQLVREDIFVWGNPEKGRFRKCASMQRGTCTKCDSPFVEKVNAGPAKVFVFIPTANFSSIEALPSLSREIYYNLRVSDTENDLPKHSNHLLSQLAITRMIMNVIR